MAFEVRLPLSPGYISAIYFIVFDIIVISMVDVVIARILSRYYYRSIYHGRVITLRGADIPGMTTYLLDAFWSWPNIIARAIKIAIIICIFVIDWEINSAFSRPSSEIFRTARYQFNASQEAWRDAFENRSFQTVAYTWQAVRNCHLRSEDSDEIWYYSVAFDLEYNITIEPDGTINAPPWAKHIDKPEVLDNTTQCLSPDFVADDFVVMTMQVIGCSELKRSSHCGFQAPAEGRISNTVRFDMGGFYLQGLGYHGKFYSETNPSLKGDWSQYEQPELFCIRLPLGLSGQSKDYSPCLLISIDGNNNTLVEHWLYNSSSNGFRRTYAGPVFDGVLSIGNAKRIDVLVDALPFLKTGVRWDSLSSILVADSMIYKRDGKTITAFGKERIVTTLPGYTLILLIILVSITVFSRIIICYFVGYDSRPHLNTTDGLSSIAKGESRPTGRSLTIGPIPVVGLQSAQKGKRFGLVHYKPDHAGRDLENIDETY